MSNNFPTVKERILQLIESKGLKKEKFFEKIGMTYGNFTGSSKKTPINSTAISNILLEIPDTNAEWLLTGKGEMLRTPKPVATKAEIGKGIPLIPADAMAGIVNGEDVIALEYECEYYSVPMFKNADFLIPVRGSSMQPKYYGGDVVACQKVPMADIFFQWNKIYVLDTVQGALIKRVDKGKDDNHILLVSENEKYKPFELSLSQIRAVALVVGVIRLE